MAKLTGAVINVYSEKVLAIEPGARGTAAISLPLDWYTEGQGLLTVTAESDAMRLLGHSLGEDSAIFLVGELLKRAAKALVYNLNTGGSAAQKELTAGVTAKAAKVGSRGNDLSVTVEAAGEKWRVRTFMGGSLLDSQVIAGVSGFEDNGYLVLEGSGTLGAATVKLEGGLDGSQGENAFDSFLSALETMEYQTIAYTGSEQSVCQKLATYVRNQRESGRYIQAVMGNYPADSEGVISVANGVKLADGKQLSAAQCCAYLAGATAAAQVNDSLTYDVYDGAADVSEKLTKEQQLAYKEQGLACFILNNGKVKLESDINTLVTYTNEKGEDFAKNRVIRVIDSVCGDIRAIFDSSYAGKEHNNLQGRNRFKAAICDYLATLQGMQAIEDYTADDVLVLPGAAKDQVLVDLHLKPVDSMEKAHITLWVR